MYKELIAYFVYWPEYCAAPTDATTAELFGKYLLAEHECTESDSSSDLLVSRKHSQTPHDKLILAFLRSFAIPTSSATVARVFTHGGLVLLPNRARTNVI